MGPSTDASGDERATVTFITAGGERREVSLESAELANLIVHSKPAPATRGVAQRLVKPTGVVLAALLTTLILPAIVQQWNDRQRDIELKTALVKQMGESSAVAITNVRFLGSGGVPEVHVADRICSDDKTRTRAVSARCSRAREAADFATARVTTQTRVNWRKASASTQAQLFTYFEGKEDDWDRYSDAVEQFLAIFTTCDERSAADVRALISYSGDDPREPRWKPLFIRRGQPACTSFGARYDRTGYSAGIDDLTDALLERRKGLIKSIATADTRGLSTTRADLWGNLWLPVGIAAVLGLACLLLLMRHEPADG